MTTVADSEASTASSVVMPIKTARSRRSYTLKERIDVIEEVEKGKTKIQIAKERKMTLESVKTIWKNKDKIRQQFLHSDPNSKKSRCGKYRDLEKIVFDWLDSNPDLIENPDLVKQKAKQFAHTIGFVDFKPTNVWFEGWKKRFFCNRENVSKSEQLNSDLGADLTETMSLTEEDEEIVSWLDQKWPSIKSGFNPDDIYNADETGLLYNLIPGSKNDRQQRMTILTCANMSGSDKRLLAIGCQDLRNMPVNYAQQERGLLSRAIFNEWVNNWDQQLVQARRRVLLLVDDNPVHVLAHAPTNITVAFFPSTVTSILHPCYQGIVQTLKTNYRRYMIEKVMIIVNNALFCNSDMVPNICLKEAIYLLGVAWDGVSRDTIANAFGHSQLVVMDPKEDPDLAEQNERLYEIFCERIGVVAEDSMSDYVTVDDDIPLHETEEQDEASVIVADNLRDFVPNPTDILTNLNAIRTWIGQNDLPDSLHDHVAAIEKAALRGKIDERLQGKVNNDLCWILK